MSTKKVADFRQKVAAGGPAAVVPGPIRLIGGKLSQIVTEAEAALLADKDQPIYQRAGQLVRVICDSEAGTRDGIVRTHEAPIIRPATKNYLIERMTAVVPFEKFDKRTNEWHRVDAPALVASASLERGSWPFSHLAGIAEAPRLRPDGTILDVPGYDALTGLYYAPSGAFESVPVNPTKEDAVAAAKALLEVIYDFPVAGKAHKAAWLAALLTPFARPAYDGPSPLFLIDKNQHGAGGSLMADVIGLIATGRDMSRAVNPRDDEEMRKRITAIALAGDPVVLIDNVTGLLGGAALNAALTGTIWCDRILGRSEMTAPLRLLAIWFASANNCAVDRDTTRRTLPIRLDSPLEHPEERSDFKHSNLRQWVLAERPRLVRCALTILRAYFAAGQPRRTDIKPWGSYEGWCATVRQAVVFAGLPDPCDTRIEFVTAADSERIALVALLNGLEALDREKTGLTATEIIDGINQNPVTHRALGEAILELCPQRDGRPVLPSSRQLGKRLSLLRRRVVGNRQIDRVERPQGIVAWRVAVAESKESKKSKDHGSGGSGESIPLPHMESGSCHSRDGCGEDSRETPHSRDHSNPPNPSQETEPPRRKVVPL